MKSYQNQKKWHDLSLFSHFIVDFWHLNGKKRNEEGERLITWFEPRFGSNLAKSNAFSLFSSFLKIKNKREGLKSMQGLFILPPILLKQFAGGGGGRGSSSN